ncbi:FAD/NAD(P)-binding domain-containing protein [Ramaria rubella]|nr:FAD/NAD(P)-binding domain-containing protein [Ramaria rubella]
MVQQRILIIGAGIAGPVLAVLLKLRGFEPVIYEKNGSTEAGGIGLVLQPNGLKVLNLIPGFVDRLPGASIETLRMYSITQDKVLAENDIPAQIHAITGLPLRGCPRAEFHHLIAKVAEEHKIEIHWGHKLTGLQQSSSGVEASFENGEKATGSFLIGCDGLHSTVRGIMFGDDRPQYLGLSQTAGWTPITPWMKENTSGRPCLFNYFGEEVHMVSYNLGDDRMAWYVTRRTPEEKESWKQVGQPEVVEEIKNSPFAQWGSGARDLVQGAAKFVKYGLYSRKEMETWFQGRVVLLGDAAHPMPPHVGQGANQSFEDMYHLILALKTHGVVPSSIIEQETLESAFQLYEKNRKERASMIVQRSIVEGEKIRVVKGELCATRDNLVANFWRADPNEGVIPIWSDLGNHPFTGESKI